ncbi:MAG: FAD-dependent oxidoreductase, partial [Candidatus Izemoplasmatales bacterium]
SITPRKGEYCLFDKQLGNLVNATIFQLPTDKGKGVLVTPSVEGNLLIGPSSVFVADKEDTATTPEGIRMVLEKARQSVKDIPTQLIITGFAGLRATEAGGDFILGEVKDVPGLFACVGIESPGLTSAPAIALDTATWVAEYLKATKRIPAIRTRKNITRFAFQTVEKQKALFQENPDYGKVICRCELVTLAEIKASIHRPLGAKTLDGVKRRTQAGTGRCQGGFCSPKIMQILGEELRLDPLKITKFSDESTILVGVDKDWL